MWEEARRVVEYAHKYNVTVEAELGKLAGIEDDVQVGDDDAQFTDPGEVQDFVTRTGVDSWPLPLAPATALINLSRASSRSCGWIFSRRQPAGFRASRSYCTALPPYCRNLLRWSTNMAARCPTPSVFPKMLREAAKMAVCKINVDSDIRLAMTGVIRKYMFGASGSL